MKQVLRYAVMVGAAVVSILLFLLASASDNSGFFDRYYTWLLGLNAAVAGALLVFVVVALARLYVRYKSGKFGSRLMTRLVLLFAGIGILPGLVIFLISVRFVSNSIESWFNVKIEAALESGVSLGVAALDQARSELGSIGEISAATIAGQDALASHDILTRLVQDQEGMLSAVIIGQDGKMITSAAAPRVDLKTDRKSVV